MAVLSKLYKKRVLIVDDQEAMRQQMRQAMTDAQCERLLIVASIKAALDAIAAEPFDIILCDYYLGDNTNGQQFLEYIRTRDLISRHTLFIMITAEQAYQKVVLVAECAPDDYLLKPFTPAQLDARLERLLERQEELKAVNKATDSKNWARVINECDLLIAGKSKYLFDIQKIKGAALLKADRVAEAISHYEAVLQVRPLVWAKFGLAQSHEKAGALPVARQLLEDIVAEFPQYLQAYDLLAKVLADIGESQSAITVLQRAGQISPGTLGRLRTLSSLAVSLGQNELAEEVMSHALEANRYSPVREVHDFALLSKALVAQDKTDAALNLVKTARKSFSGTASDVVLAASESMAYQRAGDEAKAEAALAKAMSANLAELPPDIALAVADACLAMHRDEDASRVIRQAIQNNPDDASVQQKVRNVLAAAGGEAEQATALIESSKREVIRINNEGVRKAEAGELGEAVKLLASAADQLPNNLLIVGNAALAMAQYLVRVGPDPMMLRQCLQYRHALAGKSPDHPKLAQIDGLLVKMKK